MKPFLLDIAVFIALAAISAVACIIADCHSVFAHEWIPAALCSLGAALSAAFCYHLAVLLQKENEKSAPQSPVISSAISFGRPTSPVVLPERKQETEIIAYRMWRVIMTTTPNDAPPYLGGISVPCSFAPCEMMVAGHGGLGGNEHRIDECICGIHGFKTMDALIKNYASYIGSIVTVVGRVALGGRVIGHKDGYRASHGYPQVFYRVPEISDDLLRFLADTWKVEIVDPNAHEKRLLDTLHSCFLCRYYRKFGNLVMLQDISGSDRDAITHMLWSGDIRICVRCITELGIAGLPKVG